MNITIEHYPSKRICNEFYSVIEFLKNHAAKGYNKNWHWGRWEWLLGHPSLDEATLPSIGMFMDDDKVVGLVTHDMREPTYILLNPKYNHLKSNMADYASTKLFVDENDTELIEIVKSKGYGLTEESEYALELDCTKKLSYSLDNKFSFTDYHTDKNVDKYVAVIHKGFGNSGDPPTGLVESDFPVRPHENPKLAVFILAPNGEYAAHCGTWYCPDTEVCYVEPVVTIPDYRGCGLGKAVVYESINRCIELGAKKAVVISNQQFYHSIGFEQYSVCHLWKKCQG